jgi:hypothetical protein
MFPQTVKSAVESIGHVNVVLGLTLRVSGYTFLVPRLMTEYG